MITRSLPALLALGLTLGLLTSCNRGEAAKGQTGPKAAPVTVVAASRDAAPLDVEAVGHVDAIESVAVRAQIGGSLTRIGFQEGQDVQKGQVLFQIDDRPLKAALTQAEANLARDLAQSRRAVEQLRRYEALYKDGGVSQDQYDQFRTAATALDATVAADRAAVEQARVQLGYATITAPISGRVGKRLVTTGNLIRANDAEPLVVIHQLSPIEVSFAVPEAELPRLRARQAEAPLTVSTRIDGDDGPPVIGKLSFIDNSVDPATGTIKLRARFDNHDKRLWPGQFVRTTVNVETQPDAILVPSHAVQAGQSGSFVFVVGSDMTADARPVTVARTIGDRTVIASGLAAGELVVTDGHLQVVPGGPVRLTERGATTPAGSEATASGVQP